MATTFVYEDKTLLRKRILALLVLLTLIAVGGYFSFRFIELESLLVLTTVTPLTLLFFGCMSGLFFFPIPLEIVYITGISGGSNPLLSIIAVITGFTIGNGISYLIGWKLSRTVTALVSAKKIYKVRRFSHKYGVYAIIGMNLIPAPSPLLTFGLGLTKYPFLRLFVLLVLANIVKFMILLRVNI